jgi:thiol-disulfide isomerase/thioredoxin
VKLALAILFVTATAAADPIIGDPIIGSLAPPLEDQKLGDGVVVVDFFATWCEPCRLAMAALDELVRRRGIKLVVVDVGEPAAVVNAFVAAHPLPPNATLVMDPRAEAAQRWGQHRFPTTFVLGGGVIRHINRGYGPGYAARLDGWVANAKNAGPPPPPIRP